MYKGLWRLALCALLCQPALQLNASPDIVENDSIPYAIPAEFAEMQASFTDTIPYIHEKFAPKRLILPGVLIGLGVYGTAVDGMNDYHLFKRNEKDNLLHFDDYLEWGLFGWTFLGNLFAESKNHWVDQLFLLGVAEGINAAAVQIVKHQVNERRPNWSNCSFPSGHTSNAFLGAHLAFREFKDTNLLYALSGYPLAALVAFARVHSNRHWVADVVGGAGFGIMSVELAYLIYPPIRNRIVKSMNLKRKNNVVISPVINQGGGGVYFSLSF